MEKLKEIAHLSGKPGLFKIVKPTRTGVIVETLDAKKEKTVISGNSKVSVLHEISVFVDGDGQNDSKPLPEIFEAVAAKFPNGLEASPKKMSDQELISLFLEIEPNFDRERVYTSDIKKILSWYQIIKSESPDIFEK
jgi:hypothetical protein